MIRKPIGKWATASLDAAVVLVVLSLSTSANSAYPHAAGNQSEVVAAQVLTTTVYLPLIAKYYDPSWVAPFGTETHDYELLARASEAGMRWVRLSLRWDEVEPTKGSYNWAIYDDRLAQIAEAGLTPIVYIWKNPSWAAATDCGPLYDNQDLADFLAAAVSRYKDGPYNVKYWEIYNEPDHWETGTIGCMGNNVPEYVTLLKVAHDTIKALDPEAHILLGGLAMVDSVNLHFLDQVLEEGGGDYFDIVSFHFYAEQINAGYTCFDPPECTIRGLLGKAAIIRDTLARHGYDKPLILTETAKRCFPVDSPCSAADLEAQADYVPILNVRGMSANLEAIIWYTLDWPGFYHSSLLDQSGNPKPAYVAYQTLTKELAGARYERRIEDPYPYCPEIEQHLFSVRGGRAEKRVLWTNPIVAWDESGQPIFCEIDTRSFDFPTEDLPFGALRLVRREGSNYTESIVTDGDDGNVDGVITLSITPSPIYVEAYTP